VRHRLLVPEPRPDVSGGHRVPDLGLDSPTRPVPSLALDSATRPLRARRAVEETARILAVYPENAATMRLPMVGAAPDCGVATTRLPEIDATTRLTAVAADDAATSRLPEVTLTVGLPTIALPTVVRRAPADLAVFRTPAPHVERTLLDVVESTAALHPGAPALDAGTPLTYREMLARVDRVAGMLQACGVRAGDRVGVRMSSGTADLYLGILGVLAAGAAYVPVDADDPEERAATIWEEADVCGVLADGMRFLARRGPGSRTLRRATPTDDAWIIFTSGSTGKPKGVAISHASAAAFVDAEADLFLQNAPLGPGDRVLAGLSVAFDASCEEMWLAWRYGACLMPAPRSLVKAGAELGRWLVEREVTVVSTVPTLAALWPPEALSRVRLLIFGGEACPPELVERLAAPGREVWNTYGPTEATVVACGARLVSGQPVRIGLPLRGWQLAVLDAAGNPVSRGETGELVIAGAGLGRYLDRAKDAEKYRAVPALSWPRAYRTGDLVSSDSAGLLFVGRADDQVKLGGRRIELGEIDTALLALPGVTAAAAAVKKTKAGGEILVGYLAVEGAVPDLAAARATLAERLPAALVPVLAVVDLIPTRISGKVDRKALPWPPPGQDDAEGAGGGTAALLPGTTGWLARAWHDLLGVPVEHDSDFFALGGTSLATATLVSRLRERYPTLAVADVYQRPTLRALAAHLDACTPVDPAGAEPVTIPKTKLRTTLMQFVILTLAQTLGGLRWVLGLAILHNIVSLLFQYPLATPVPWWTIIVGYVLLASSPGRVLVLAVGVRLLRIGITPGRHPRGGRVHLQLSACERLAGAFGIRSLSGTRWAARYARAIGCRVGRHVDLRATVPVTGWVTLGDDCAVEPGADLAGHWIDGGVLHVGPIHVGERARIGGRSTLLPGAHIGDDAVVEPGTCVDGRIPAGEVWAGSPAECVGIADDSWPAPVGRRSWWWGFVYTVSLFAFSGVPLLAAVPGLVLLGYVVRNDTTLDGLAWHILTVAPLGTLVSILSYTTLLALTIRVLSCAIKPGFHKVDSLAGWSAWLVETFTDGARSVLFPFYAGLITPFWLRRLGATIGKGVEASTVTGIPKLMSAADGSFLADDTQLAPYELGGGWMRLGKASVGERSFVGNSGIVSPGHTVPDHSLIAVLANAPAHAEPHTSWMGRPAMQLPRVAEAVDAARTFDPPRRLVLARALIEVLRVIPWLVTATIGLGVFYAIELIRSTWGWGAAIAACGVVLLAAGIVAALVTTVAKWVLVGRFKESRHPLWSSFVWRNELFDVFYEVVGVPLFAGAFLGTPVFNVWARTLGVKIGKWVWLESHWLPETDLIRLGDGVTINRGCVLQTHLFHDRLMRISPVHMGAGSSLGPKSIALPGTSIGAGARIGAGSLVMRGEHVPAGTRWTGNPIVAVNAARAPQKTPVGEVTAVRRKPIRPASVSRRVL
jgi:non-ribosomal peptide synthetase-like protein